jgi:HEPN domain-containing protein
MGELPDTNEAEARRWLGQATEDLAAARRIADDPELAARLACFLAHLAVEKALKALLIAGAVPFRKIHDLLELRVLLPTEHQEHFDLDALADLNGWVIDGRYADDHIDATHETAHDLVESASTVLAEVERLLS